MSHLPELESDPVADVFFSLIAVLILTFMVVSPQLTTQGPSQTAGANERSATELSVVANEDGLDIGGRRESHIPLDLILTDTHLASLLRASAEPPMLRIARGGADAAFQFEALAAKEGVHLVKQQRLTSTHVLP